MCGQALIRGASARAHTTAAVVLPATEGGSETPVGGAQVKMIYTPLDQPAKAQEVTAVEGVGARAGYYEADAELTSAGEWQVTVRIDGPAGSGATQFTNPVLPATTLSWWWIGGGALIVLVVLGYVGTRRSKKGHEIG